VLTLGAPAFSLTPYAALRALHLGAPVGVLGQVAAGPARALLDALRPTVVYGVPPLVMALARAARRADWHGVRRVITGGARLTPAQHTAIAEAWPVARVATFYGAAETSFIAMNRAPDPTRPDDMGPLFPGVSVVAADDTGLRVRTPYAARQTMIDAGTPQPLADADGAVALADRVHLEGDRVVLRGRADDVLNLGGALIDPGPVERAVEALPWVAEAALVPVPDARRSATAGLVAVPVGAPPAAAAAALRAALPPGAEVRPRHVAVIAEPPRTPGGKLDRRALTARLARAASA
jgi:acyl-coenzyme A synthetase/AMP-(fatty) acid ligase